MELYNDDCFNVFPKIGDKTIDLFVLDLPYANFKFGKCTACKWDLPIDLDKMWIEIKRIMKPNAVIVFFCNTKFGYALIDSNPKWFKYDLIWKKSRKVGFLSANKQPLKQHENIYIFNDKPITHSKNEDQEYSTYNPQKTEGKPYKVKGGKSKKVDGSLSRGHEVISKEYKNKGDRHPTSILPDIEVEEHENLYVFNDKKATYNPQKTERDKDYKHSGKRSGNEIYDKDMIKCKKEYKKEDGKHPTSILPDIKVEEHENLYVFDNINNDDLELTRNLELRAYAEKVFKFIGKSRKQIDKDLKSEAIARFIGFKNTQFALPILKTYNELIEKYKINEMEGFIEYDILKDCWEKEPSSSYNPQMTEGKPYETKGNGKCELYNKKRIGNKNKGDRHPTSILPDDLESTILQYNNPHKTIHRTQKPEKLLEWLIKTYSNEEDTVMDFCMGSGTAAVACKNTNRKFIGVEMDKEIYDLASNRINNVVVI